MIRAVLIIGILFILPISAYATDIIIGAEAVFGDGIIKQNIGIDNHKIYAGFVIEAPGRVFLSLALGGAIKINPTKDFGSTLLFHISAGLGYKLGSHRVSIVLDHVSNANLAPHNPGLDAIGVRYGYRF